MARGTREFEAVSCWNTAKEIPRWRWAKPAEILLCLLLDPCVLPKAGFLYSIEHDGQTGGHGDEASGYPRDFWREPGESHTTGGETVSSWNGFNGTHSEPPPCFLLFTEILNFLNASLMASLNIWSILFCLVLGHIQQCSDYSWLCIEGGTLRPYGRLEIAHFTPCAISPVSPITSFLGMERLGLHLTVLRVISFL